MKASLMWGAMAVLALGGCSAKEERTLTRIAGGIGKSTGRYVGIGFYEPGRLWEQLKPNDAPTDSAAAVLHDDDMVIVMVDTRTGEVRQCGNLSGHCIGMSPWAKPAEAVLLTRHEADFEREAAAAQAKLEAERHGTAARR